MSPIRFSIRELLVIVAICAVASVSLVRATPIYSTLFFSFAMLVILASILMSIASLADRRAYWVGFAISSGMYMYFAHIPDGEGNAPRQVGPEVTTQLLILAFERLHPDLIDPTELNSQSTPSQQFDPICVRFPIQGLARFDGFGVRKPMAFGCFSGGCFSVQDEIEKSESADKSSPTEAQAQPDFEELIKLIQTTVQPKTTSDAIPRYQTNLSLVVGGGQQVHSSPPDRSHFMSIGHSAFALLFGWIGGHFTCFFYHYSRRGVNNKMIPPKIGDNKKATETKIETEQVG